MNLFDKTVNEALRNQPNLSILRMVVEKELLHHDILRILSQNHLLKNLTFIGGTCLRLCYGGTRLSEDLDFTGGADFTRDSLSDMAAVLIDCLNEKYGLPVKVTEPIKETGNVDTWKIKVETRPQHNHLPAQRINIDICALPSYEKRPMMLLNPYGIDMGTAGLVIQAQSREEIYADKLIAFALRPNRIKYRDLWDIVWLHQLGLKPALTLIPKKLNDRHCALKEFLKVYQDRRNMLFKDEHHKVEFTKEMSRFLPSQQLNQLGQTDHLWVFVRYLLEDLQRQMYI